jgi:8-oxo-dGTP pyrophosphatase MutT (NUDIX family)
MNAQPEAAVAILHAQSPEESILLIRRAARLDDPWSGHWSFPGGRRSTQDQDLLDTALRELDEECGIRLPRQSMETALPVTIAGRAGPQVTVAPFVFRVSEPLPTVLDPREAVQALWLPVSTLRDPARHSLQAIPGMPAEPRFPAINLNGMPLWGFTYRLLKEWLASL